MKKNFCLTLFYLSFLHSSAQKPGSVIDVLHYQFDIELTDSSDQIKGKASITVKFLKAASSIEFELVNKDSLGNGMVGYRALENNETITTIHGNDKIILRLRKAATAGETRTFTILYIGIPRDGLIIGNNKYNHRGFFSDNWPNRAHNWLPCVDHPSDKATVDFIITAPMHYQVVANGIQIEETNLDRNNRLTHYRETTPVPPKIMVIGLGDFAVNFSGDVNYIPVYSWVYPEDRQKGFYDYAQAMEILPFFIDHVGPYGYKKLANVQSKTQFGGMENANTIFYSENSVTGTRISEALMAHEIAHQWFGDMATETEWAHIWLSEGFATNMTILYLENKYGSDTARKMLIEDRSQVIAYSKKRMSPVVDSSITNNYMELLNINSYQKGSWILHMLRSQLGDSVFWKSIRAYYNRYAGSNASTEDLQKVFEEISGKDLKQFFRQWLYIPGQPQLDINWKYDAGKKLMTVTIVQLQVPLFQFPLELLIYGGAEDGMITKSIRVTEKQTRFAIPMNERPQKITADPNVKLLFEAIVREEK